ncbi:MAG: SRPBCC family protein [Gemmatimonadota bacterium]|nr:SRPBCC family protein [Gemmatimonadota bacterium]
MAGIAAPAIEKHIDIVAKPERVWSVMRDCERWNEWTASISSIRFLEAGSLRVGQRALVRQPKLPPGVWKVTELIDGREFTWVSAAPGLRVHARHVVEATTGGSRVTLSLSYEGIFGGLLLRLTRGITERYVALEANGLKAQSESNVAY